MTPPFATAVRSLSSSSTNSDGALRAAFQEAPHGMVVADARGTILLANRRAEGIFAYSAGQMIGRLLSDLLPEPLRTEQAPVWTDSWKEPRSRRMGPDRAVVGLRTDGMRLPLEIDLSIVQEGASSYVVASIVDISDRLNVEARLDAANKERADFERLVADIAARFVSVAPEAVDETIVLTLRQIAGALNLDRGILWRKDPGEDVAVSTHYWIEAPHSSPPPEPLPIASIPFVISRLEAGEVASFTSVDDLPNVVDRATVRRRGPRSAAVVPLPMGSDGHGVLGALAFSSTKREQEWAPAILERLRLVAGVISQTLSRKASQVALQNAVEELLRLRDRVTAENVELRREARGIATPRLIVSESAAVRSALTQVEQVASTPSTVLLMGETGSGKEVFAQAIHELSPRHQRPMVRVSCAAIPSALIESELFGRERGAYTGALSRQIGRFELANQSTLFLDEIGELLPEVQVKLLRVLQDRVVERLGSTQAIKVDVRIIAATNRDLEKAVSEGTFREDLYYRLNVFPIVVPPLRERIEDIPGLVWSFIDEFSRLFGRTIDSISKDSLSELQRYPWPGNVRELRNVIERAVILSTDRQLVVSAPKPSSRTMPRSALTLAALEVEHIRMMLTSTGWRVRGPGGAAERLGLKPTTLESRMARLGIERKKTS